MVKSFLLCRRASVFNEVLAQPGAGTDCFEQEYQYDNPFANKRTEENTIKASIQQHAEPKMLPPREENRKHYDEEVKAEIEKEKLGASEDVDWVSMAKGLSSTEARLLKLIQRNSGQDPIQSIFPFSGLHNVRQFLQTINTLASKGWCAVKDNKLFKTDTTDRLLKTYSALQSGAVVASTRWASYLLW
jgi:hypothetical protein